MKSDDGWKRSAETRAKMSASRKALWADPEFRARIAAGNVLSKDERLKRQREYLRAWRAQLTPEEVEVQRVAHRERKRKRREHKRQVAAKG
jgi:hypothetical protein